MGLKLIRAVTLGRKRGLKGGRARADKMSAAERAEIARKVLNGVSRRDRDILNRFYVLEQSQEQICADMGLSYNQFRLLKSRAKARFGEMGKKLADGIGINLRKNI